MTAKLTKVSQSRGAASRGLIPFECISFGSSIVVHCVWDFKQGAKPQLRGLCDANPILFLIHSNKPHSKGISPRKSAVLTPGLGTYCHWERKMLKRQCGEHPWTLPNANAVYLNSPPAAKEEVFLPPPPPNVTVKPKPWLICHLIAVATSLYTAAAIVNLPGLLTKLLDS